MASAFLPLFIHDWISICRDWMCLVWKFKLLTAAPGLAFLCLAFPSSLQVPQGCHGHVLVCACSRGPSLPTQDHGGCWCAVAAWALSPPGQMPSLRNDQSMCSESSCQQLCVLAVGVCTPMGWKPSLSLCLKGTPGPFWGQQCPTPLDDPKTVFTGLDSLLPIAMGWGLAGWLQTQPGAIAWWITLSYL